MKVIKKIILTIIILAFIGAAIVFIYIYFKETKKKDPFSIIPSNAVFLIETTNLTKGWNTLSESKVWKHMMKNEFYKDINESASTLDSLIKDNKTMNSIFKDRKLLISAHMISAKNYDFIFVIDLQKASKITFIVDYIKNSLLEYFDYTMNKTEFMDNEIIELTDIKAKDTLYLSFIDNLMVCSYTRSLLEMSIREKEIEFFVKNHNFKKIVAKLSQKDLFKFYVNYSFINGFVKYYVDDMNEMAASIGNSLFYTALNFNIVNEQLLFDGYTSVNDSLSSYLKALSMVEPGESRISDILSDNTAIMISMCFENFNDFFTGLKEEFSKQDSSAESYQKKIDKVQKLLKIDLQRDFFDWIGNEICYARLRPLDGNAKEDDILVGIHAKNMDDARIGLNNITSQIRKRSIILKFKSVDYQGYEINYLDIKGFFRLFLGKLFGKLEKPYFTYINDYVVFSNSPSILMDVIDDFKNEKTLSKNSDFSSFKSNFSSTTNASVFVQMPKLYSYLYFFSKNEKQKSVQKNKDLILSFTRIGFQMKSDGNNMFKTKLIADFDENALLDDELEKFETAAEDISNLEIAALGFRIISDHELFSTDGDKKVMNDQDQIIYEGTISNGKPDGKWKTYSENGNVISEVNYKQGIIDGEALFYYDTDESKIRIKVMFEEEKIVDNYREFYKNGVMKADIEYDDGLADGYAKFYYTSGKLKIKGEYSKGEKKGKWLFYTETGQVFDKQKLKKTNIK